MLYAVSDLSILPQTDSRASRSALRFFFSRCLLNCGGDGTKKGVCWLCVWHFVALWRAILTLKGSGIVDEGRKKAVGKHTHTRDTDTVTPSCWRSMLLLL